MALATNSLRTMEWTTRTTYADPLLCHLKTYLGDQLSNDPVASARARMGAMYVEIRWLDRQGRGASRKEGLKRLGCWCDDLLQIDTTCRQEMSRAPHGPRCPCGTAGGVQNAGRRRLLCLLQRRAGADAPFCAQGPPARMLFVVTAGRPLRTDVDLFHWGTRSRGLPALNPGTTAGTGTTRWLIHWIHLCPGKRSCSAGLIRRAKPRCGSGSRTAR